MTQNTDKPPAAAEVHAAEPMDTLLRAPVGGQTAGGVTAVPNLLTATVVGATAAGDPLIALPGEAAPRAASAVWMEREPEWGACQGLAVLAGVVQGEDATPIIVGLLGRPSAFKASAAEEVSVQTDARREVLKLSSEKELVLECGKAKIALRADGRITILGGYLLSRSSGVNKIKGGSVQIN